MGVDEEIGPNAAIPLKNGRTLPISPTHLDSKSALSSSTMAMADGGAFRVIPLQL
jgi:hypothetical protein